MVGMGLWEKWERLSLYTKINIVRFIIFISSIALLLTTIVLVKGNERYRNQSQLDSTITENEEGIAYPELKIQFLEDDRHLDNIYTYRFEIINTETNEACKLSDGILSMAELSETLETFLSSHPYRVYSVGIVDNKFYIQQDINDTVTNGALKVNIVSLSNSFSSEDWLSLTEATYKNANVLADNIFTYTGAQQSKHYIYIYIDSGNQENAIEELK